MTIECRCPGCGGRFRAADSAVGQRVKCPRCGAVIALAAPAPAAPKPTVPPQPAAAGEPGWFVRTADDTQHGPMTKAQLDRLVTEHRLDAFCEVRRADWDAWRMIEEVYPALAIDDDDEPLATGGQTSRVWPCPDCGQTVSRRAAACPHCGCPLVEQVASRWTVGPPPVPSSSVRSVPAASRHRLARRATFLAGAIVLLVGIVAAGIYLGILIRDRSRSVASPAVPVAPSPPPAVQNLDAQRVAQCKDEVATNMARQVDDALRLRHDLTATIPQLGEYARALEMAQEMADPRSKRSKEKESPEPAAGASPPYESQFESLHRDCRAYLDAHVTEPVDREETIWNVGRDWVKMRLPEQQMLEDLLKPKPTPPETR